MLEPKNPYIQTYTGRFIDLTEPKSSDIDPVDLAVALSREGRFGNHTSQPYSVLQHSLLVHQLVESHTAHFHALSKASVELQALMHDAAEAYLKDIPRPIKNAMRLEEGPHPSAYDRLETRFYRAIMDRFRLPINLHVLVKTADTHALEIERRQLMPFNPFISELPDCEMIPLYRMEADANTNINEFLNLVYTLEDEILSYS